MKRAASNFGMETVEFDEPTRIKCCVGDYVEEYYSPAAQLHGEGEREWTKREENDSSDANRWLLSRRRHLPCERVI